MTFAKTDIVPVRPEGEGWYLIGNYFLMGKVCLCGCLTQNAAISAGGPVSVCPECGRHKSCFKDCAFLSNEWSRDNMVERDEPRWYNRHRRIAFEQYERAITYGGYKNIERCSETEAENK